MEDCERRESEFSSNTILKSLSESKSDVIQYNVYVDHQAAFNELWLWSNPAWLNTEAKSIHFTAVSEWVHHHRIWVAVDRSTIAEIIGGVRAIIPSSRLATYGDYRYDLDLEEMYDNFDAELLDEDECVLRKEMGQIKKFRLPPRVNTAIRFEEKERGEFLPCPSFIQLQRRMDQLKSEIKEMEDCFRCTTTVINRWLSQWSDLLSCIRKAVDQQATFDAWTDILWKVCFRFLSAVRVHQSLMRLMEAEMPLIIDYKQLRTDPITMIELLSLPQPYLEESLVSDTYQTDFLWLKLSSGRVRKLWPRNATQISSKNTQFADMPDPSIGATNFLRRRREKKVIKDPSEHEIEVSEIEAEELLGSLISYIDGLSHKIDESPSSKHNAAGSFTAKIFFPEAHGDWTKTLFPYHMAPTWSTGNVEHNRFNNEINQQAGHQILSQRTLCIPSSSVSVPPPNFSMAPPLNFHPPLAIPPPTIQAHSMQAPSLFPPLCHQPPQDKCYYDQFRQRQSHEYANFWGMTNTIPEQSFIVTPCLALHPLITTDHHVNPAFKSYNQTQGSLSLQTGPSIQTQRQRSSYSFQQNVMAMLSAQRLQIPQKTVSVQNEYYLREMSKNRTLQNISNANYPLPNHPLQFYYQDMGHPTQPVMNLTTNSKENYSNVQNLQYEVSRSLLKKPTVGEIVAMAKLKEANKINVNNNPSIVRHRRPTPRVKSREDLAAVMVQRKNITNNLNQHQRLYDTSLRTSCSLNEGAGGNTAILLQCNNQNKLKNEVVSTNMNKSQQQFQWNRAFFSRSNNIKTKLQSNQNIFLAHSANKDKGKTAHGKLKSLHHTHNWISTKERMKNLVEWKSKFSFWKAVVGLYGINNKVASKISADKRIPHYSRLYKKKCHQKGCIASYGRKLFRNARYGRQHFNRKTIDTKRMKDKLFDKVSSNSLKKKIASLKNLGYLCKDRGSNSKKVGKTSARKRNWMNENGTVSEGNLNQRKSNDSSFIVKLGKHIHMNDLNTGNTKVKYFNQMADSLLCDDEFDPTKLSNSDSKMVDVWTHFKIAIIAILRKASNVLLNGSDRPNGSA